MTFLLLLQVMDTTGSHWQHTHIIHTAYTHSAVGLLTAGHWHRAALLVDSGAVSQQLPLHAGMGAC